jgi:bifunctional non-homologous end joining protein LigD
MNKPLDAYRAKRDFSKTPEPSGGRCGKKAGTAYVIQKHAARRLHYDFRLELNGVLKSWAVPEGPSLIPGKKRLAVHVEDHPLEYGDFEGVIPEGEYGSGTVMVWDRGTWTPESDPEFGYRKGHLKFRLNGEKLKGAWHLVRMARKPREKQEAWLLFKSDDEAARPAGAPDILEEMPRSAATGRDMDEIAREQDRVWSSKQGGELKRKKPRRKAVVDPAAVPKAKAGEPPRFVEPALPTAVETAPSGADWVHEIKYDGYRVQVRIDNGRIALLTRKGLDWTERFPAVARAAASLPVKTALIDAEVVVQTEAGVASFTALVDALKTGKGDLVLYAFDLLHLDGFDLRDAALRDRKAALAKIIAAKDVDARIRFSDHLPGDGATIFRHASRLGLEGIVSKKLSSPYRSGRVTTWVKLKSIERKPFVVAGFVPSSVAKNAIGALVLGEYVDGTLVASGHVGSGFSAAVARELWQKLDPLRTQTAPLKDETAVAKGAKWVKPELVAEIEYRNRTGTGIVFHATFRDLVEGADPQEAVREKSTSAKRGSEPAPPVKLTNPSRLLWPEQGITKQGLVDFYTEIADWILPHISGRPLSLVRCPDGVDKQCFFQKHRWAGLGKAGRDVPVSNEKEPALAIDDLTGLLELVQASVLEIHPWGSQADRPELPDRATIDLDPGDDVPWEHMTEAALEVRNRLSDVGLQSFVKTTGGKGLHVVFPLTPKADWDTVKSFTQWLAEQMAADRPDRYTANMAKRERHGRIYLDYLRNGMGATAVGAYSTRARPGAAVATPLAWDELGPAIRANHFTVENLPKRLAFLDQDPWAGILSLRQELPSSALSRNDSHRLQSQGASFDKLRMRGSFPGRKKDPHPELVEGRTAAIPGPSTGLAKAPSRPSALAPENIQRLVPDAVAPSKEELTAYWKKVAKAALEYLGRRPLKLVRHVEGKTFFHQGPLPPVPDAVHQLQIETRAGGEGVRLWVDSLEGLLSLLEIGVVELHPWGSAVDDIERPDTLVFALEPDEAVEWKFVAETALRMRDLLTAESLDSWPKLTGTGVHVMVPVVPDLDWDEAHGYSESIAKKLAATAPERYVTTAPRDKRHGRLYVNWLCNGRGSAAIGAYSPIARRGFPIAAPVTWRELERGVQPDAYTLSRPPARRKSGSRRG